MISCDVIQDLLPLYADGQASEGSKLLIEEHIRHCEACSAVVSAMCTPIEQPQVTEDTRYLDALKKHNRKIKNRIILTCVLTVLLCIVGWCLYMELHFTMEIPALVSTSEEDILMEMPQLALTQSEKDFAQTIPLNPVFRDSLESEEVYVIAPEDAEAVISDILPSHAVLVEVASMQNTVYISYTQNDYRYILGYMDSNNDGTIDAIEKTIGNGNFSGKGTDTVYSLRYIPVLDLSQYEKQVLRHVWFGFLKMP